MGPISSVWLPIFLLLLTGLAFAMPGLALERILNPRVISDVPADTVRQETTKAENRQRYTRVPRFNKRLIVGFVVALVALAILIPSSTGKTLASVFMSYFDLSQKPSPKNPNKALFTRTPSPAVTGFSPSVPTVPTEMSSTPTILLSAPLIATATPAVAEPTSTPIPTETRPVTYRLQKGEYPYCIARRFNVNPDELLALSGLSNNQTFYAGAVLQIPQTGNPYPGERMQKVHPTTYTVSGSGESMYTIACQFGDIDPLAIAQANRLPVDSLLFAGQQLTIP